jgi:hypothetical protein
VGLYSADGSTRYTKSNVPVTAYTDPDPVFTVTATIVRQQPFYGAENPKNTEGMEQQVLAQPGQLVRQSDIDEWFPTATVTTVSPATGTTGGGTLVTLTGTNLDGVTAVTIGGNSATISAGTTPTQLKFTTPAHSSGAVNIVLTDDSGTITKTSAFTYA